MQITRLHLLVILFGLFCAGVGFYKWKQNSAASIKPSVSSAPLQAPAKTFRQPVVVSSPPKSTSLPPVARRSKALPIPSQTYEVAKGDTLWRIAIDHSPVHQGPGWVTIWRVNQKSIKNFDRLEVGTSLQIPPNPRAYVMRYWQPRRLAQTHFAAESDQVDLAELPVPADFAPGRAGWPPSFPKELEIALLQSEPMPHSLEIALLRSTPLPASLALALARSSPATDIKTRSHLELENTGDEVELDAGTLASLKMSSPELGMHLQFQ